MGHRNGTIMSIERDEILTLEQTKRRIRGSVRPFYVYEICLHDGTPFYVGKGTAGRIAAHEAEAADTTRVSAKHRLIRAIQRRGVLIGYKLVGFYLNEEDALAEEKRRISEYGRRDEGTGILTNLSDGGEGHTREYPPEQWEVDEDGVLIAKELVLPRSDELVAPRFRSPEDLIWELADDNTTKGQLLGIRDSSGPQKPLLAEWQDGGWTIQVFFDFSPQIDEATGTSSSLTTRAHL